MSITPKFYLKVSGDNVTTNIIDEEFSFTEKLEYTLNLTNSSKSIDFQDINSASYIVFIGDSTFTVSITHGGNTIDFEVDSVYTFSPSYAFYNNLSSITIKNLTSSTVNVKVLVYGGH